MSKIIVLDAGHTPGYDPGTIGNGLQEANLTGDIISRIQAKLGPYDVDVRLCPRTDSLEDRVKYANNSCAHLFLSIHINSGGGTGFESYVYNNVGETTLKCQDAIHTAVMNYLSTQGVVDRGKKRAGFYVLKYTEMPAILLECLFIDNEKDAAKLKDESFLNGLAKAIADGTAVALGLTGKVDVGVPIWARDAVMWAVANGLINNQTGSKDFYRFLTVLYRYDRLKN